MSRPYILAESHWKDLQTFRFDLAVLPWGATEAHNYHLPYGTDNYESEHIAAEAARKAWKKGTKVTVLPTIPFGVNTGQKDIYLDINLNPSTQMAILDNIIEVLNRQGLKKLLIVNSHGGNDFKTSLRELGLKYPDMFLATSNWFRSMEKEKYFDQDGDHADEMETSLIMHLAPELVLPLEQAGEGKEKKNRIKGFREGWAWTERNWPLISKDTGVGNPKAASREKGQRFFNDVTDKLSELYIDIAHADPKNLYQ
ncbi:creatininase family protein [Litoribacter populi]|uniref:creatininase family protein n=1 Tax=Litoribacter populi TaxID=2598460 RepID=UPI00117C3D6F|nr:creatininase family protein [Litoribacter populi]